MVRTYLHLLRALLLVSILAIPATAPWASQTSGTTVYFTCYNDSENGSGVGKFKPDGSIDWPAVINTPYGMTADAAGNVYFGLVDNEFQNFSLRKLTSAGQVVDLGSLTQFEPGTGVSGTWSLDLALSPAGDLYFTHCADPELGTGISKRNLSGNGEIVPMITTTDPPSGLAFDRQGNFFYTVVTHTTVYEYHLMKVAPGANPADLGVIMRVGCGWIDWSMDLAVSEKGEVYFNHWNCSYRHTGISKMRTDGTIENVLLYDDAIGATEAPVGLAFDRDGNLYFGSMNHDHQYDLRRLNTNGTVTDFGRIINQYQMYFWSFDLAIPTSAISLISPNGGEVLRKPKLPVHWRTDPAIAGTSVTIELWNSSGRVASLGTDSDPDGEHTKIINSTVYPDASDYRVKIISGKEPRYTDISDKTFRIANPAAANTNIFFTMESDVDYGSGIVKLKSNNEFNFLATMSKDHPVGVAVDAFDNLYYGVRHDDDSSSEGLTYEVFKLSPAGQKTRLGTAFRPSYHTSLWSFDLAVNSKGEVYFNHYADETLGTGISKFDASGRIQPVLATAEPPIGLAFDKQDHLYFSKCLENQPNVHDIYKYSNSGAPLLLANVATADQNWEFWPFDLAVGPDGNIYFNHYHDAQRGSGISKLSPSGAVTLVVKDDAPIGPEFDAQGRLFYGSIKWVDFFDHTIDLKRFNGDGSTSALGLLVHQNYRERHWSFDMAILSCPMSLVSPNGGEVFRKPNVPVHWMTNPELAGTSVSIELWNNTGRVALATDSDPDGDHIKTINSASLPDGSDYKVKIISGTDPQYWDTSDAPFRIANAPAANTNLYYTFESDADYGTGIAKLRSTNQLQFPVRIDNAADYPAGLALDTSGNLYYGLAHSDEAKQTVSYAIIKYTPRGESISYGTVFRPATPLSFWSFDLAANSRGEVFFNHYGDPALGTGISKINTRGDIEPVLSTTAPPIALTLDRRENLYFSMWLATSTKPYTIYKYSNDNMLTTLGDAYVPNQSWIYWSFDMAVAPNGEIYFNHYHDINRGSGISKMSADGTTITLVTRDEAPVGLAFDAKGNLFFGSMKWIWAWHHTIDLKRLNANGTSTPLGLLVHQYSKHEGWAFDLVIPNRPVAVITPNGNEVYWRTPLPVHWKTDPELAGTEVKIELWTKSRWIADLGEDTSPWGEHTLAADYPYMIRDGSDYRVRVYSLKDPQYWDESDAPFTITDSPLILHSPQGGEVWLTGSTQLIHWRSLLNVTGPSVRLQLWRGGAWIADLGSQTDTDGDGIKVITVPDVDEGSNYQVFLNSISMPNYFAYSPALTIRKSPQNALSSASWAAYE